MGNKNFIGFERRNKPISHNSKANVNPFRVYKFVLLLNCFPNNGLLPSKNCR